MFGKFDKRLPKFIKSLKGKKVVLYGAGVFFETVKKYFDLSGLNVIGISDRKFANFPCEEFLGYKAILPDEIEKLKPDVVIVTALKFVNLIEDLHYGLLADVKIKIKPLIRLSFFELIKEIWNS